MRRSDIETDYTITLSMLIIVYSDILSLLSNSQEGQINCIEALLFDILAIPSRTVVYKWYIKEKYEKLVLSDARNNKLVLLNKI